MEEIWKEIENYEGKYWISNYGRLRTIKKGVFFIMKTKLNKQNYHFIYLWKNGKRKRFCMHRLVAKYFVPNPNNYDTVVHIKKDFNNNRATNLKWVKREYTYFKSSRKIEYNGKKYNSARDFYKFYCKNVQNSNKLNFNTFRDRLYRGWTEEETLFIPYKILSSYNHRFKLYEYKGKTKTLKKIYELSKNKINYKTLCTRLCRGWSVEEALEIPVQSKRRK